MRSRLLGFLLAAFVLGAGAGVFAQQAPSGGSGELDKSLRITGVIYSEYAYLTGLQPGSAWSAYNPWQSAAGTFVFRNNGVSPDHNNTFRVQRVYFNFLKNFTENWSMRITTDINNSRDGSTGDKPYLYLKYAFIQYKDSYFGFLGVNLQAGLIATPIIGLLDDLSDCRWTNSNMYDASKNLLVGQSFDYSADFGLRLGLTFANMVTITGAVTNGEGYAKVGNELLAHGTAGSAFASKAMYGTLVVNPIRELYLSLFYRYETTAHPVVGIYHSGPGTRIVYGGGVAWKSDLIRVGAHMFFLQDNNNTKYFTDAGTGANIGVRVGRRFALMEAYLMMNLGAVIPTFPLLVHARLAEGWRMSSMLAYQVEGVGSSDQSASWTWMGAFGLGWRFNQNFRVLAYYERYSYNHAGAGYYQPMAASNFMLKTEVAF